MAQQPWTVVTVMFTSGHLIHVAGAVGCIFFLGRALERRVGSAHLLGIYLLAGITGSIVIATATSAGVGNPEVSVGASAAFLGLLGALAGRPPTALMERLPLPKIVVVVLLVRLVQPMVGIGYWTSSLAPRRRDRRRCAVRLCVAHARSQHRGRARTERQHRVDANGDAVTHEPTLVEELLQLLRDFCATGQTTRRGAASDNQRRFDNRLAGT